MTTPTPPAGFENGNPFTAPLHGYQGDRAEPPVAPLLPASLTVAVSREAGSRGASIARRAARKLGWQVYTQELLEYIAQEGNLRQGVADTLPAAALVWAEERLQQLRDQQHLGQHPSILDLARVILALGAQGNVVLVGRGAGFLLPRGSTLHVRIIAPAEDRVTYLSQLLRLTEPEAAEQVRLRDERRAEYLADHLHCRADDSHHYDLLLNSSLLGEELCAELIAQAARAKRLLREPEEAG